MSCLFLITEEGRFIRNWLWFQSLRFSLRHSQFIKYGFISGFGQRAASHPPAFHAVVSHLSIKQIFASRNLESVRTIEDDPVWTSMRNRLTFKSSYQNYAALCPTLVYINFSITLTAFSTPENLPILDSIFFKL